MTLTVYSIFVKIKIWPFLPQMTPRWPLIKNSWTPRKNLWPRISSHTPCERFGKSVLQGVDNKVKKLNKNYESTYFFLQHYCDTVEKFHQNLLNHGWRSILRVFEQWPQMTPRWTLTPNSWTPLLSPTWWSLCPIIMKIHQDIWEEAFSNCEWIHK